MTAARRALQTDAERLDLIRRLSEIAASTGISLADTNSPGQLAMRCDPRVQRQPPHLKLIDDRLTRLLATPNGRQIITTPSQVGKSTRISRWFPFWWLTMRPQDRIILGSFAASLATSHSAAARELVRQYGAPYGLFLRADEATRSDWSVTAGGGMRGRGIRGGIQGQPMDLAIVDDPFADRADAESVTTRNAVWDWYSSSISTRRAPGAREVIVATRWHPDDLIGRLLAQDGRVEDGGKWDVLHLPAIAMPEDHDRGVYADPLDRVPGEPLTHPLIDPDDDSTWVGASSHTAALLAHWAEQKSRMTSRDWNATAQGTPFDAEGALLTDEIIRAHTKPPPAEFTRVIIGIDPSGGGRDNAGLVAFGVASSGDCWWFDDRTAHLPADRWSREACLMAYELDATEFVIETNYGGDQATTLVRQAWTALQYEINPETGDPFIPGNALCPLVRTVHTRKKKVLRAEPIAQAVITSRIWFAPGDVVKTLATEWQLWSPGSEFSPGALDAAVHAAHHGLPPITRPQRVTSQAHRRRDSVRATPGGLAARSRRNV